LPVWITEALNCINFGLNRNNQLQTPIIFRHFSSTPQTSAKQVLIFTKHLPIFTKQVATYTKHLPTYTKQVAICTKQVFTFTKHLPIRTKQVLICTKQVLICTKHLPTFTKHSSIFAKHQAICRFTVFLNKMLPDELKSSLPCIEEIEN
jgi:hypothetical protein